jgi:hypothetical protein
MSQAYVIRRAGQRYRAPNQEALSAWISAGRVRLDDEVKGEGEGEEAWRRFERDPELRRLFSYDDCVLVRRGGHTYRAHELALVVRWAREGKVAPSDEVYVPEDDAWWRADEHPTLRQALLERAHTSSSPALSEAERRALTAPVYDAARLYLVASDLMGDQRLEGPCWVESWGVELSDLTRVELFERLHTHLNAHQEGAVREALSLTYEQHAQGVEAAREAIKRLSERLEELLCALREHRPSIGLKSPERFVVGSAPSASLHPDERVALRAIKESLSRALGAARLLRELEL